MCTYFKSKIHDKNMDFYIYKSSMLIFIDWLNYVTTYDVCSHTKVKDIQKNPTSFNAINFRENTKVRAP